MMHLAGYELGSSESTLMGRKCGGDRVRVVQNDFYLLHLREQITSRQHGGGIS